MWLEHVFAFSFALLLRSVIGLGSFSGMGKPPMHGDFEAQRHWMEVTLNVKHTDWYVGNETFNELGYWGLDYPPLTAYHSFLLGKVFNAVHPESVALGTSRGIESHETKILMRTSALVSDALTFIPAVMLYCRAQKRSLVFVLLVLTSPALILIDHGHFQFNCVAHGLVVCALALVDRLSFLRAFLVCVTFSLALNFKQMTLYYALAFFVFLLRWAWTAPSWSSKFTRAALLGFSVVVTFTVVWFPFRSDPLAVVRRVFPFERGIFEDKVANFWGVTNVVVKWKQVMTTSQLQGLSALLTFASAFPSLVCLWTKGTHMTLALFCVSLSFFLFSFQVHEKSILLPLVPALLEGDYFLTLGFSLAASLSMMPLMMKDGLGVNAAALNAFYILLSIEFGELGLSAFKKRCIFAMCIGFGASSMLVGGVVASPLEHLPDLFVVVHNAYSLVVFGVFYLYANTMMWRQPKVKDE